MNFKEWFISKELDDAFSMMNEGNQGRFPHLSTEHANIEWTKIIAAFYMDPSNNGKMPTQRGKRKFIYNGMFIPEPEIAVRLSILKNLKKKNVDYIPKLEKLGTELGLPETWLYSQDRSDEALEKIALNNTRLIAAFYNDPANNKRMPSAKSKLTWNYNGQEIPESEIGSKLNSMKMAKKGQGTAKHYDSAEQLGIDLGLPKNWLVSENLDKKTLEKIALNNTRLIAAFYNDPANNKRMPSAKSKLTWNYNGQEIPESEIGSKFQNMKTAKQGKRNHYDSAEQLGIELGLPKNWLESDSLKSIDREITIQPDITQNPV